MLKVAASMQNQAVNALLFLYREALQSLIRTLMTCSAQTGRDVCRWCFRHRKPTCC
ncbi:MAG: hypothetical protein WBR56_18530 [Sedimenticolaceae bacterium]